MRRAEILARYLYLITDNAYVVTKTGAIRRAGYATTRQLLMTTRVYVYATYA